MKSRSIAPVGAAPAGVAGADVDAIAGAAAIVGAGAIGAGAIGGAAALGAEAGVADALGAPVERAAGAIGVTVADFAVLVGGVATFDDGFEGETRC